MNKIPQSKQTLNMSNNYRACVIIWILSALFCKLANMVGTFVRYIKSINLGSVVKSLGTPNIRTIRTQRKQWMDNTRGLVDGQAEVAVDRSHAKKGQHFHCSTSPGFDIHLFISLSYLY